MWCGGVLWCGGVWCGVVGSGVVWCSCVWRGGEWCGVVWCGVEGWGGGGGEEEDSGTAFVHLPCAPTAQSCLDDTDMSQPGIPGFHTSRSRFVSLGPRRVFTTSPRTTVQTTHQTPSTGLRHPSFNNCRI